MKSPIEQYAEVEAMKRVNVLGVMEDASHRLSHSGYTFLAADLDSARNVIAKFIQSSRNIQSRVAEGVSPDHEEWDWLDRALERIS